MTNVLHPNLPALTPRLSSLPVDERGFPVPWFVQWFLADGMPTEPGQGKPDFRVVDSRKLARAIRERRCWVCGDVLGRTFAFVIGPMCAVNRVSSEPPSHRDCAEFSARACPFLTKPKVERRDGLPEGVDDAAGVGLKRNPGVALVWITDSYRPFRTSAHKDESGKVLSNDGILIDVGPPKELLWFAEGRPATRQEILHSIDSGMPLLHEAAEIDGPEAHRALDRRYAEVVELLPAAQFV